MAENHKPGAVRYKNAARVVYSAGNGYPRRYGSGDSLRRFARLIIKYSGGVS